MTHTSSSAAVVDRPTQLICISDIYLLICQQTNTKDIAGQSASAAAEEGVVSKLVRFLHHLEWAGVGLWPFM